MSNIFSGKKSVKDDKIESDFVGGGGVFDTDIYPATIKTAYIGKASKSDARSFNLLLDINGKELRSQIWVTNRNGEVTYKDKKTGEDRNLPGFSQVNSLCMLVAGKELGDLEVEEVTVKLYDFDAKKELPKAVDCFTELHGEKINVAVQHQIVDKTENDGNGKYVPTGDVRDVNEIIKFFPEDKLVTISEIAHYVKSLGGDFDDVLSSGDLPKAINKMEEETGNYADKWLERNRGKPYDKSKGNKGGEGKSFSNKSSGSSNTSKSSGLFDDDDD